MGDYSITAIVSTYDADNHIAACLDDLLRQTIADRVEILVIDAASPGNERDIVERYQRRHPNIRYIRTPDRVSLYRAWNIGIEEARGEFITNANTDDGHRPDALELMVQALNAEPRADFAVSHTLWTDSESPALPTANILRRVEYPAYRPDLAMMYCILGPHPVWRRGLFDKVGRFDERYVAAGDFELQMRMIHHGCEGVLVPEPISLFYQNLQGLTHGSDVSMREAQAIRDHYRPTMPIDRIYRLNPDDSRQVAHGWYTLGTLALRYPCPWSDRPLWSLPYAELCYRRAIEHHPQHHRAIHNLAAVLSMHRRTDEILELTRTHPEAFTERELRDARDGSRIPPYDEGTPPPLPPARLGYVSGRNEPTAPE